MDSIPKKCKSACIFSWRLQKNILWLLPACQLAGLLGLPGLPACLPYHLVVRLARLAFFNVHIPGILDIPAYEVDSRSTAVHLYYNCKICVIINPSYLCLLEYDKILLSLFNQALGQGLKSELHN